MTGLHIPDVGGMDTLGAALAYAAAGWFVVPVRAGTKSPGSVVGGSWNELSSRDPRELAAWFAGTDHGLALHAGRSGAVVFDADDPDIAPAGYAAVLAKMDAVGAPFQSTDRTGTRRHYLFRMPPGMTVGNGESNLPTGRRGGINVRGLNGVIVVSPTVHSKDDGLYAWQRIGALPFPDAELTGWLSAEGGGSAPAVDVQEQRRLLASLPSGPACAMVRAAMDRTVWAVGGRDEMLWERMGELLFLAIEGHPGAGGALAWLFGQFAEAKPEVDARKIWDEKYPRRIAEATARLTERGLSAPWFRDPCEQHESLAPLTIPIPPVPAPPTLDEVIERLKEIADATEQRRLLREFVQDAAPRLSVSELQEWRDQLKDKFGLAKGDFNDLVDEACKIQEKSARREKLAGQGKEVVTLPIPGNPAHVARDLAAAEPDTQRKYWRDDFYLWRGTHWEIEPKADVRTWVYQRTADAVYLDEEDDSKEVLWKPTPSKVNAVMEALGSWVCPRPTNAEHAPCIALENGVYDVGTDALLPHSPDRFNLFSLPFAYVPGAACPQWLAFLAQVLPADSIAFLQEWAGYLISGKTDRHKIASLVGAPRSGKGTIGRILAALLGKDNVTGPVLASLTGAFGLEPLIGKSLAIFGDVKWSAHGVADATELLKTISGDDTISVHRKNRTAWEGRLPTRFMLLSNNTPSFTDSSGALAGRMIHLHFTQSFAGREDIGLSERLLTEMPGILLWAIEGLRRLETQGRFTVPAASAAIDDEVRLASSPHAVFAAEGCVVDPASRVELDHLWTVWERWCAGEGATPGDRRWFTRNLKDALPGVGTARTETAGVKTKWVTGLRIREDFMRLGVITWPSW